MIRVTREPPKCKNCGKVLKWLPWKDGKPQRPVDPKTGNPCECWKTKGKSFSDNDPFNKPRWLKKTDYVDCPYCDGHYEKALGNESHEEIYHKDKKVHSGEWITGWGCFSDEVLYYGGTNHWYLNHSDENGDFLSVDGIENVREFAKTHGVKHIVDEYLLQ